jgi:hypothetical protein
MRERTLPTMKDYEIGSEDFLVQYNTILEDKFVTCIPLIKKPLRLRCCKIFQLLKQH